MNERERGLSCKVVVQMDSGTDVALFRPDDDNEPPKRFAFDGAFGMDRLDL